MVLGIKAAQRGKIMQANNLSLPEEVKAAFGGRPVVRPPRTHGRRSTHRVEQPVGAGDGIDPLHADGGGA